MNKQFLNLNQSIIQYKGSAQHKLNPGLLKKFETAFWQIRILNPLVTKISASSVLITPSDA